MEFKVYMRAMLLKYFFLMKIFELIEILLCHVLTKKIENCVVTEDLGAISSVYKLYYLYIAFTAICLVLHVNKEALSVTVMVFVPLIGSACFIYVGLKLTEFIADLPYASQDVVWQHTFMGMYTINCIMNLLPFVYVALIIDAVLHYFGQPIIEPPQDIPEWRELVSNWNEILRNREIETHEVYTEPWDGSFYDEGSEEDIGLD